MTKTRKVSNSISPSPTLFLSHVTRNMNKLYTLQSKYQHQSERYQPQTNIISITIQQTYTSIHSTNSDIDRPQFESFLNPSKEDEVIVHLENTFWTRLYGGHTNTLVVKRTDSTRFSSDGRFYKAVLEEDGKTLFQQPFSIPLLWSKVNQSLYQNSRMACLHS